MMHVGQVHMQKNLIDKFQVTGVDINPKMLQIARKKVPEVIFIQRGYEEHGIEFKI